MSNNFANAGPCKESRNRRHAWLDVTKEADEPRKHFLCTNCGEEAFDLGKHD